MFQLYDVNHNKISPIINYKDYHIEQAINTDDLLYFLYPTSDSLYPLMAFECYIRDGNNEYVIKEINAEGEDWAQFVCKINLEDLKGKVKSSFETVNEKAENSANLALTGTGWTVGYCDVTKRRTVRKAQCSVYEILKELATAYACEITYNAVKKTINIHQKQGADRGVYFAEQLNLKQLDTQANSHGYVTRLIPIGKDGLDITSVNNGINYVSNYQYSTKVITAYWIDNRYTVAQSLHDDAVERLAYLSKPIRAYSADIIDLASVSDDWNLLDFGLGDFITLMSESKGVREQQRIIKIDRYPEEPERSTIEIANRIASLTDIISRVVDTSDTVDLTTDTTNALMASSVEGDLNNAYIPMQNVGELNVTIANIGTLIATKADITLLEAETARIDNLYATSATVINLEASNARIDILEANSATIDDLQVERARIGDLEATSATITQLNAETARINDLYATSATITQLDATNANITNLQAQTATINTVLSQEIFVELATIGKIVAGSSIIADTAIGSAQISSLSATKISAGILDAAIVTIQGTNGRLKIANNRLQVFDGTSTLFERIALGDVNGDGSIYGLRIRGADGTTILFDENGQTKEGFTDGYNKLDNGSLDAAKLDIASVVTRINDGTTTIDSSKVYMDNKTLEVAFSTIEDTVGDHETAISSQSASITALNNSIALKVDTQTYSTKMNSLDGSINTINSTLNTQSSSISVLQGQIVSKVSQVEIDNSVNAIQVGGRNLLLSSGNYKVDSQTSWIVDDTNKWNKQIYDGYVRFTKLVSTTGSWVRLPFTKTLEIGKEYTISIRFKRSISSNFGLISYASSTGQNSTIKTVTTSNYTVDTWTYFSATFTPSILADQFFFTGTHFTTVGETFDIEYIKVELGNKATDWTPAPEDVQGQFDIATTRISTAESSITQLSNSISLKVDTTTYTSGLATKEGTITKSSTAPSNPYSQQLWLDTSVTPNQLKRWSGSAWVKATPSTAGEVGAYSQTDGSALASRVSTAELKITDNAIVSTVRNSTSYISDLSAKATVTDLNTTNNNVSTALNTANTANSTANTLRDSTVPALTTRVTTAETSITQQAGQIALKVSQTEVDNGVADAKLYTDNTTGNLVNNTAKSGTNTKWKSGTIPTVVNKDFQGITIPVLELTSSTNVTCYSDFFEVDPSKAYEVTMWLMVSASSGNIYMGAHAYNGSTANGIDTVLNSTGALVASANTNPYFYSASNPTPIDTWIKRTAYIMPAGTDLNSMKNIGENISWNMRMLPNTTKIRLRWLNYNSGVTKSLWMANPKVVEVDPNTVGRVSGLATRISTAESSITQNANNIALKVSTTDYTGNTIASLINQTATTIKLQASKINLVGAVTVLSDITGNLGTITAGTINGLTGYIGGFTLQNERLYKSGFGISSNLSQYAFWAGETNGQLGGSTTDAKVKIGHLGDLTAVDATISGTFTQRNSSGNKALELANYGLKIYDYTRVDDFVGGAISALETSTNRGCVAFYGDLGNPLLLGQKLADGKINRDIVIDANKETLGGLAPIIIASPVSTINNCSFKFTGTAHNIALGGLYPTSETNNFVVAYNSGYGGSFYVSAFTNAEGTSATSKARVNNDGLYVWGSIGCSGTKNRIVYTKLGKVALNAYETTDCLFGDVGEAKIGEDGQCYIFIDPVFRETVDTTHNYQVFTQPYGRGELFVIDRQENYFIVEGTPNLHFAWEIKAKQRDYTMERLEIKECESSESLESHTFETPESFEYGDQGQQYYDEFIEEEINYGG